MSLLTAAVSTALYRSKLLAINVLMVVGMFIDPFVPDTDDAPDGSEGLLTVIKAGGAIVLTVGMALSVIATVTMLILSLFPRFTLKDTGKPLAVFLILAGISTILQVLWGMFDGLISLAAG